MTDRSASAALLETVEPVPGFADLGALAFTTTRRTGSFGTGTDEPVREVLGRWDALRRALGAGGRSFATASQVHGARVLVHIGGWNGWLRADAADGHVAPHGGVGMAVTIADCTPVFLAHPGGAIGILHAGWRGTAAGIVEAGVRALAGVGVPAAELHAHLGPAICGRCYEVGPEVHVAIAGRAVRAPEPLDLRVAIADRLRSVGVREVTISPRCTRCDAGLFFSHRGGDGGRQVAVIAPAA